jgi:hypothetical protein
VRRAKLDSGRRFPSALALAALAERIPASGRCLSLRPSWLSYPELNFRFTDDDRGEIVNLLNQVYAIMEHRKQEAHDARNADLMTSYRPRPRLSNGKAQSACGTIGSDRCG